MSVEVLAGPVVAHGGPWVGVAGGDLHIAQVDTGVEHRGDEVCRSMCGCIRGSLTPVSPARCRSRLVAQVTVHPGAAGSQQDGSGGPHVDGVLVGG